MIIRFYLQILFFLFGSCLFFTSICLAETEEQITITELVLSNSENELLLYGLVQNGLRPEVAESLQSGISVDFSFFVELYKTTENWPKELVTSLTFNHSINYDTLRDSYTVSIDEKNSHTAKFSSLLEAQEMLERINGVIVTDLSQLLPDQRYELRIRVELSQKTMELGLNNILPLIKRKGAKTKWQNIEFSYSG